MAVWRSAAAPSNLDDADNGRCHHVGTLVRSAAFAGDIVGPAVLKLAEDLLARTCSALKVLETESPLFCCWHLHSCQCVDSQTGIAAVPK